MRRDVRDASTDVAELTLQLAVLLEAGAVPDRAFANIARAEDDGEGAAAGSSATLAARVSERIAAGETAANAIDEEGGAWRWIASAWRIAQAVGAPLSPALRSMASVAVDAQAAQDDVRIALAEPAATARLMLWLPAVAVVLGVALGFDTATILLTNPLGIVCLVLGTGLVVLARLWTKRLIAQASESHDAPGLREELTAIALTGGASPDRARRLIDDADLDDVGDDHTTARILRLSQLAGVPAVDLLRASSSAAQQRARTSARMRAAKLSTALLLPLGVCTLPAFFLLGVAPLMISVITTTGIAL